MFLCFKKEKKQKPMTNKIQNKLDRKDSNGQLIFEDIRNLKIMVQKNNNKIEVVSVN